MAVIEHRGESVRLKWLLGGGRDGAPQSCTFKGGTEAARKKKAAAAKLLVESRGHNMTKAEVETALEGAAPESRRVPTFKQWVDMWIQERTQLRDIQPDTIKKYRQVLHARVVPYLGSYRLVDIKPEDIKGWLRQASSSRATVGSKSRREADRLIGPATVRRAHSILHACLGAAVPKWISANPAARPAGARKHSGLPKVVPFEGMFLTADEVRRIHGCADPHVRDLIFVAVRTGLRLGELLALEARHVVFSPTAATVMVRQALKADRSVGPPKSVTSRRAVPVGDAATAVLRARVQGKRPGALVFPSPTGKIWCENNLRMRFWLRAVAAAQRCVEHPPPEPTKRKNGPRRAWRNDEVSTCDCPGRLTRTPRFHDLRHTHASMLIEKGWSAKKIQARMGHANYQTTMNIYGHLRDAGNEGELKGVEELLDGVPVSPHRVSVARARRLARRAGVRRVVARSAGR